MRLQVASRATLRGMHGGGFMEFIPTGKQMTLTGIDIVRIKDGKAVERWGNFDDLSLMRQLGIMSLRG
jgi:predicted ester cyclase